jgi:hypothetical protein
MFCVFMQGNRGLGVWVRISTQKDESLLPPCSPSPFFSKGKSQENSGNVFLHGEM